MRIFCEASLQLSKFAAAANAVVGGDGGGVGRLSYSRPAYGNFSSRPINWLCNRACNEIELTRKHGYRSTPVNDVDGNAGKERPTHDQQQKTHTKQNETRNR